jgi:hypothetical protein
VRGIMRGYDLGFKDLLEVLGLRYMLHFLVALSVRI